MSKPPDHQVFKVTRTSDATIAELGCLRIIMREPQGAPSYWIDANGELWKDIGRVSVADTGLIEIWPYEGVSDDDCNDLRGAGCEAWRNGPCETNLWSRHEDGEGGYWDCCLSVEVKMILAAEGSNHEHAPLVADLEPAA
ncbi:hypothetical protein [Nocardia sp. NPDC057455]|uniref:hypothetical protein n=1 Tax=Nocardia sp. NPDC057455 TaxID=3346138 RepID=UPI00366F7E80